MFYSIPRYWMVGLVCLLMIGVLYLEYVRVTDTNHLAVSTGFRNQSVFPTLNSLSIMAAANFKQLHDFHNPNSVSFATPFGKDSHDIESQLHAFEQIEQRLMLSGITNHTQSVTSHEFNIRNTPQHDRKLKHQRWYPRSKSSQQFNRSSVALRVIEKDKRWHKMQRFHAKIRGIGISSGLQQLVGLEMLPYLDLHQRGFPEWRNTPVVASHLPSLEKLIEHLRVTSLQKVISSSLNPDIIQRGHFQKKQIEKFCVGNVTRLPSTPQALTTLFTHLLYDDSKRIIFCYVPKNGCSNMKRLLLILNGLLPPESSQQRRPPEMLLKKVNSFRNLTSQEALFKLKSYYKFAIVRNPLERLLSAYRNKLEHPVVYAERRHFPSSLQLFIMSLFRPSQIRVWLESLPDKRHSIFPSFKEFVTYMKMFPLGDYNEHFAPFSELCHPCSIKYDFYANFKSMDYDITAVLEYLSIPSSYYPSVVESSHNTTALMEEYFRLITWREKMALFNAFRTDLNFYYSLYPENIDIHKQLLTGG